MNDGERVQLVFGEMRHLVTDEKPIRLSFSPSSETHAQLRSMARGNAVKEREIVRFAVRTVYQKWVKELKNG